MRIICNNTDECSKQVPAAATRLPGCVATLSVADLAPYEGEGLHYLASHCTSSVSNRIMAI